MSTQGRDELPALVRAAVKRDAKLFAPWPDISEDDLISTVNEGLLRAKGFNKSKGSFSNWVYTIAHRRLVDLFRARSAEMRQVEFVKDRIRGDAGAIADDVDPSLPIREWLPQIYRRALHIVGTKRSGRGPQKFSPAHCAAMLAVQHRLKLSCEGTIGLLEADPVLCRSIRLLRLPSIRNFQILGAKCRGVFAKNRSKGLRMSRTKLTEQEAADRLGISSATMAERRRNGKLPFPHQRVFGQSIRYLAADIEKYERECTIGPEAKAVA